MGRSGRNIQPWSPRTRSSRPWSFWDQQADRVGSNGRGRLGATNLYPSELGCYSSGLLHFPLPVLGTLKAGACTSTASECCRGRRCEQREEPGRDCIYRLEPKMAHRLLLVRGTEPENFSVNDMSNELFSPSISRPNFAEISL